MSNISIAGLDPIDISCIAVSETLYATLSILSILQLIVLNDIRNRFSTRWLIHLLVLCCCICMWLARMISLAFFFAFDNSLYGALFSSSNYLLLLTSSTVAKYCAVGASLVIVLLWATTYYLSRSKNVAQMQRIERNVKIFVAVFSFVLAALVLSLEIAQKFGPSEEKQRLLIAEVVIVASSYTAVAVGLFVFGFRLKQALGHLPNHQTPTRKINIVMVVVIISFFIRAALGIWDQIDASFFDAYPGFVFNVYYYAQFVAFEWTPLLAVVIVIREAGRSSSSSSSSSNTTSDLAQPLVERTTIKV